jgi:transposase
MPVGKQTEFSEFPGNVNIFQIVGMDQMEQSNAILFLRLKSLSEKAIHLHHELVAVLQENVVSYSSVTRFYSAGRLFWA